MFGISTKEIREDLNKCQYLIIESIMILIALASIITAFNSYYSLVDSSSNVQAILKNWNTVPISQVVLVPISSPCPSTDSFNSFSATMAFPGSSSPGCACPSKAAPQLSNAYVCSSSQLTAGCIQMPEIGPIKLSSWRGSKICVLRKGDALTASSSSFSSSSSSSSARPNPSSNYPYSCPKGYLKCGNFTNDIARSTCVSSSSIANSTLGVKSLCPVTLLSSQSTLSYFSIKSQSAFPPTQLELFITHPNGEALFSSKQSQVVPQQLPLVELAMSFLQTPAMTGPCFETSGGDQSFYSGKSSFFTAGDPTSIHNEYPNSCEIADNRYKPFDYMSEISLLRENFLLDSRCSNMTLSEALLSNYWKTPFNPCVGNVSSGAPGDKKGNECDNSLLAVGSCNAKDKLCLDAKFQSKCGKLVQIWLNSYQKIGLFQKQQIYWSDACTVSYSQVQMSNNPLQQAIKAEVALVVVNLSMNLSTIIMNLLMMLTILGVDFPCCQGNSDVDRIVIQKYLNRIGMLAKICKIGPIIATIVLLKTCQDIFTAVVDNQCSDSLTLSTFAQVALKIPTTLNGNIATLVLDFSSLILLPLLAYLYRKIFHTKKITNAPTALPSEDPLPETNSKQEVRTAVVTKTDESSGSTTTTTTITPSTSSIYQNFSNSPIGKFMSASGGNKVGPDVVN